LIKLKIIKYSYIALINEYEVDENHTPKSIKRLALRAFIFTFVQSSVFNLRWNKKLY